MVTPGQELEEVEGAGTEVVPQGSTSHSLYRAGSASLALIFSGKPLQRLDMRSGFSVLIQMPCPPSSPSKKKDICSLLFPRHGKSTELSHTHLLTLLTWKSAVQMTAFSASQYERPALVPLFLSSLMHNPLLNCVPASLTSLHSIITPLIQASITPSWTTTTSS